MNLAQGNEMEDDVKNSWDCHLIITLLIWWLAMDFFLLRYIENMGESG